MYGVDASEIVVNYYAVLGAAVAAMVIGYIWYMPQVAGGAWMKALGKTKEDIAAGYKPVTMLWTYLLAALTAYIMAHFLQLTGAETMSDALSMAFWAWLGFVVTVMVMNLLYENKSSTFFWVNGVYQLIAFLVMAAILFNWQ